MQQKDLPDTSYKLMHRLIRNYVRPYVGRLLMAVVLMGITAACTAALAKLMEPVLDEIFVSKDRSALIQVSVLILGVFVVKGIASYGQAVLVNFVGLRIIADLQKQLYDHFMKSDLDFFNRASTGMLISRFTNDVNMLRSAVSNTLTSLGKDSLTLLFLVAVMFYQDWALAIIAFFVFPLAIMPVVKIGKKMRKVSTTTQHEMGNFTTHLNQTFQEIRHIKAYRMENKEREQADSLVDELFSLIYRSNRIKAASRPIMETLGGVAIVIVIFYGGSQVIEGTRTTGTFFSFITALLLAYEPMKKLANLNANLQEGLSAAQRVFTMLDHAPKITSKKDAPALVVKKGQITFDDVSFAYDDDGYALKNIDMEIPAGKTVALVGPSGAGKSTCINLIPRFYDVTGGRLLIDGQDVRDVELGSMRDHIALVSQEVGLFDKSIRENILYGNPAASEKQVMEAAKNAAAHEFISSLPNGYDTLVGERGVNLSGGQRQRIAIARALLKDAPILLLDEATSALDTESEQIVQKALQKLMKGRTTLVIAHRLSTIVDADLIYVMVDGQVVEHGTHHQLFKKGGLYTRLYDAQFSDEAA